MLRRLVGRLPARRWAGSVVQLRPPVLLDAAALLQQPAPPGAPPVAAPPARVAAKARKILDVYADVQHQFPGHFVLLQVGDFFEVYGEDAIRASKILDIGLTTAPNKSTGEARRPVAMTGVPVRSVETYVERFIKAGHSVVLCEQVGRPDRAAPTARLERRVTRVITPGTLTEEGLLDSSVNNFLLAVHQQGAQCGLAWIDISTGYFKLGTCALDGLFDELARINPREILAAPGCTVDWRRLRTAVTRLDAPARSAGELFDSIFAAEDAPFDQSRLAPFGDTELAASALLLAYILQTQLEQRPYIDFPTADDPRAVMRIDAASFRALEVLRSASGEAGGSLLATVDQTMTAGGARLLARWLQAPSTDLAAIGRRHDTVQALLERPALCGALRSLLQACKDLERCYQRLALNRASGGPRDMQLILTTLGEVRAIRELLGPHAGVADIGALAGRLGTFDELVAELGAALNEKLPARVADGGVIRAGYSAALDALRLGTGDVRKARAALEARYRAETGKQTLRIDEGRLLGFYVETSRGEGPIAAGLAAFHPDGQTEGKLRYRTAELNGLRDSHAVNEAKIAEQEARVYEALRLRIVRDGHAIVQAAKATAELDVLASFAHSAAASAYVRPRLDASLAFAVGHGRHAVVEAIQAAAGRPFVGNDCDLTAQPFALITGPNMGGKSTFLRQNALIALLAQCGSFVPAAHAHVGLLDALYTRIGASDDLARDRSTFMVEMMETASILRHATPRSLVIMDEVGRGTAAEEGLALAWAIAEHLLAVVGCRTLFATHYYALAGLAEQSGGRAACLQTTAAADGLGGLRFLHRLEPGVAAHSFAIEIGRFAGLPEGVLTAAQAKLAELRAARAP